MRVSVVIPAYQVAPFITETLASVVAQSHQDWEVILVNDGSPDTPALEQAIRPFRDRLTYVVQTNRGAAAARNAALAVATGEWVAFLDGDDVWLPLYLEHQLVVLEERGLDMVWSDGFLFGETSHRGERLTKRSPSVGPVTVTSLLSGRVMVFTSATIVRRSLIAKIGGFEESQKRAQDFDLWVRLVHSGARAGYHHEALMRYRIRPGSLSGDQVTDAQRSIDVFGHIGKTLLLQPEDRLVVEQQIRDAEKRLLLALGKRHLAAGEYAAAAGRLREADISQSSIKVKLARLLLGFAPGIARWLYRTTTLSRER